MPRRNRVDPLGDLHAVAHRGLFTGNRGCLVDDRGSVVRHHRGNLWITCRTRFRGRRVGLARPGRWTPLFFLDDAVALAAGHRPCGECRHAAYVAYRDAVAVGLDRPVRVENLDRPDPEPLRPGRGPVRAGDLNRLLAAERLRPGRGLVRAADRPTWSARDVPDGTVVLHDGPRLVRGDRLLAFSFTGWHSPRPRPSGDLAVLTPPTSVAALAGGFVPEMHASAGA